MLKIVIYIICLMILLIINRFLMKKEKYFFPIIIFLCSIIIVTISVVQIIHKENSYSAPEVQTIEIATAIPNEKNIVEENPVIITDGDIEVKTKNSSFVINLLGDFFIMNVPAGLCFFDRVLMKKKKNFIM